MGINFQIQFLFLHHALLQAFQTDQFSSLWETLERKLRDEAISSQLNKEYQVW